MIRESSLKEEGALKVSKLHKLPVLLDESEMEALLDHLTSIFPETRFYQVQGVVKKNEAIVINEAFLKVYREYIALLKEGKSPHEQFKAPFSMALSASMNPFYSIPLQDEKCIVKAISPIIQLQENRLGFSEMEKTFRAMVFGKDTISWGLYFTYPQLYQDPKTHDVVEVDESFENSSLFQHILKWIRQFTIATPFVVDGKRVNLPIRLGKKCLPWINQHEGLKAIGVHVYEVRGI